MVFLGDNMDVLPRLDAGSVQLAYLDPPFNTGGTRTRRTLRVAGSVADDTGDRTGFGGRRYTSTETGRIDYPDAFDDYAGFLRPRLEQVRRLLTGTGTLYLHLDWREAHRCKLLLDEVFGPECFLNEIIWAYDYGGRARDRWPAKHDTILVYVKTAGRHFFDQDAVERVPYMAPGLVTREKAARGKLPTDVWWHTIVSPTGKEKTGYPTQKPMGIVRRMLTAS
ncbi:MAG: DNA-methyltransferase, partial [Nocardioidaceae bacterium]